MTHSKIGALALAAAAAAGIAAYAPETRADDTTQLTAETRVVDDLSSDTRIEVEHEGLEAAVEHLTNDDYTGHQTLLGLRTPQLGNFELRQTGFIEYGKDTDADGAETEGAFNTNLFYTIPSIDLRIGVGGGAQFPDNDFITHLNLRYWGDLIRVIAGGMYDSAREEFDGRGFASIMAGQFYLGVGKAAGPNLVGYIGLLSGKGGFSAGAVNYANYEEASSSHDMFFTWNSTYGRDGMDFQLNLDTGADGWKDFLFDPTVGWKPWLNKYGEHSLDLNFHQNPDGMGGAILYAFNPDNAGSFLQIGAGYDHTESTDDHDVTATFAVGTDLSGVILMASTSTEVTEREWNVLLHIGKTFNF
ncbi:MAG: hypothetical protein KJ574_03570 [Nanoarchaeota archaeon]|nr:hypothetical protein [Nanoarchaeota archaeon]